ncbi:MAG: arsenate reductase family protein [Synergistaceae bacterium]|jgi:arsenate reductase|nr:arsenate reductase family protein [Synergistaceae bacterium]
MLFLCHPKCTTCKKAQAWLDDHEIKYEFRDIKENNPNAKELKKWYALSGVPLRKFFNTSGRLYRSMELASKLPEMAESKQIALLASDGLMVKRPILVDSKFVLVGFKPAEWRKWFEASS